MHAVYGALRRHFRSATAAPVPCFATSRMLLQMFCSPTCAVMPAASSGCAQVGVDSTQQHAHVALEAPDDLGQRVESGRVHERHAAQADHDGLDAELRALERAFELFGRAEEERAVDAIDQHVVRQHHSLRRAPRRRRPAVRRCTVSAMRRMNSSAASTTPTLTATTRSTNTVSTKVMSSSSRSARGARAQQAHDVPHIRHVPGDEEQDGGERGQRHVRRPAARAAR